MLISVFDTRRPDGRLPLAIGARASDRWCYWRLTAEISSTQFAEGDVRFDGGAACLSPRFERPQASGRRRSGPTTRSNGTSEVLALASAAIAIGIAALGLAGWLFGVRSLYSWVGVAQTKPDTAFGLALAGLALISAANGLKRKWHVLPGMLLGVYGALFLAEYATGSNFGIDNFILHDPAPILPGRPSIPTSTCFLVLGPAIALSCSASGVAWLARSVLLLTAATTALAGFIAYAFSPVVDAVESMVSGFALSTSIAVLCLVIGAGAVGRHGSDRRYFVRHGASLVGLAALLALVLASLVGLQSSKRAQAQVEKAFAVDSHLAQLLSALQDAETGQRGYLVTDLDSYLDPYRSAVSRVGAELDALDKAAADDSVVGRNLPKARELASAKLGELKATIDFKRQGAGEKAIGLVMSGVGKTTMDGLRELISSARAEEETRLTGLGRRAAHTASELQLAIVLTVALILALAGYIVLETRRQFQALAEAQRAVAETNAGLERTVAEKTAEIRESEEKLRNAVADAAIGFAINTPDGAFVDANPAYCRLTGYGLDELRRMSFDDLVHPDDRITNREPAQKMLSGGIASYVVENRYLRKDGGVVWVRKSISTTSDENGKIKWIVALVEDVSERIQSEADLKHLNATLEERVRAEIGEREAAQAKLAQAEKLSALGQLAGGVAHDFNNIAQAVTGGASMIARHAEDTAKVRRYAGMLVEAAARAASITRRLLSLARRGDLKAENVEVGPLLQGLREFLAHALGPNVELRVDAPTGLPPIMVDKGQLETALVNLATNACDAMAGKGSITFKAAADSSPGGRGDIGLDSGRYVQISVVDTGAGMDAATIDRAMEPFFTTKEPGKGTGLGLPMARGFAEQSGGALEVKSLVGHGTTVTIWLPVAEAAGASPQTKTGSPRAFAGAKRILLVDDEDSVREILKGEFIDAGFEVVDAPGGELALAAIEAGEHVDLLVSDLSMPGMDGLALIRAAQQKRKELPAILLTGYAGDAATLAIGDVASGSICLLRKPITGPELLDRAAMMLERGLADMALT